MEVVGWKVVVVAVVTIGREREEVEEKHNASRTIHSNKVYL